MNYKAHEPNPHNTLSQIKILLEKEEFYQAWIVCSQYFMGVETNYHIQKALDFASKDNVYKYLIKHMNEPHNTKPTVDGLKIYEEAAENMKKEGESYAIAKAAMEQFCSANNMDLDSLIKEFNQKNKKMTREELIEMNKAVTERQAGKFARTKDVATTPTPEELESLAKEGAKFNEELNVELLENFIDKEE
jgi:hypothetical protein